MKGSVGDIRSLRPTLMATIPEILEQIRKVVKANNQAQNSLWRFLFEYVFIYKSKHLENGSDTPIINKCIL